MTSPNPSFLITGGTGFIGQALVRQIKKHFNSAGQLVVLGSECDLRGNSAFSVFEDLAQKNAFDHILHLAAKAKSGEWLARNPAKSWYENTLINANVFECTQRYFPNAKITSVLSYSMYPPSRSSNTEDKITLRPSDDNLSAYANSKLAILTAQEAYKQQYNLNSGSVVLSTCYGPSGSMRPNFGQVIPALCKKFLLAVQSSTPVVELWGDGQQERDFVFVEDAAEGILQSALSQKSHVLNLGSGAHHKIRDVAQMIAEITGYKGKVSSDVTQYSGPQRRWLNIDRARNELEWAPRTSLEKGLRLTVADIRNHLISHKI